MRLYLIRHGDALPAPMDAERPLSPKGEADTKKVAKFLKKMDIQIRDIFHSGLKRAERTAEIIAEILDSNCLLVKKNSLAPNDSVLPIVEEIAQRTDDLMIAGHMPYLSNLFSKLLVGAEDKDLIEFKKNAVVLLQRDESNTWRLTWYVTPKLL